MLQRLGSCLLLMALLASLNIHWAALQGVAWANMLRTESERVETLQEAIERTFGGDYPCEICVTVKENWETPAAGDQAPGDESLTKVKLLPLTLSPVRLAHIHRDGQPLADTQTGYRQVNLPEVPPPRV